LTDILYFYVLEKHIRMTNIKFKVRQASSINLHKNLRSKLLKCCANIYFSKKCLCPGEVVIKLNHCVLTDVLYLYVCVLVYLSSLLCRDGVVGLRSLPLTFICCHGQECMTHPYVFTALCLIIGTTLLLTQQTVSNAHVHALIFLTDA